MKHCSNFELQIFFRQISHLGLPHQAVFTRNGEVSYTGVKPVFLNQDQAIDYAIGRACFRSGEIRVMDSTGAVERPIPFSDADRKL